MDFNETRQVAGAWEEKQLFDFRIALKSRAREYFKCFFDIARGKINKFASFSANSFDGG